MSELSVADRADTSQPLKQHNSVAAFCLIEKGEWGGTCLNRGCIPTKTLFAVANLATQVREASAFGVNISGEATIDYAQVLESQSLSHQATNRWHCTTTKGERG